MEEVSGYLRDCGACLGDFDAMKGCGFLMGCLLRRGFFQPALRLLNKAHYIIRRDGPARSRAVIEHVSAAKEVVRQLVAIDKMLGLSPLAPPKLIDNRHAKLRACKGDDSLNESEFGSVIIDEKAPRKSLYAEVLDAIRAIEEMIGGG